jgi:acyl dehydratase
MKFSEFAIGQEFFTSITITKTDFDTYISFAHTRNILHENRELAEKEGIRGTLIPGRAIIARVEGEMTRLAAFSNCIMLLYGMDGDPQWGGRHTRFLREVYVDDTLDVKYKVASKKEEKGYGMLRIDYEVGRTGETILISRGNLYRMKL